MRSTRPIEPAGPVAAIRDWMEHVHTGFRYYQTACNSRRRPAVFNNELVFQLTAMAVEKLLVGLWQYNGQLPADHTLTGLARGASDLCSLDAELVQRIASIDQFDNMCVLAPVRRCPPTDAQIKDILDIGRRLSEFTHSQVAEIDTTLNQESEA